MLKLILFTNKINNVILLHRLPLLFHEELIVLLINFKKHLYL